MILKLLPLLFAVFIDSLGFGLVLPIFSPLIVSNEAGIFSEASSIAFRGFVFGLLVSSFCVGQFFGGPILGALSDRKGRKKILVGTLWLACFGYICAAIGVIGKSILLLFTARILGGVAAGNFGVAQSVIADISSEKDKIKNFGLIGMSWWTGFVIGPYLGGKLSVFGYSAPFWIAAFFSLVSVIFLYVKMKESSIELSSKKISLLAGFFQIRKAFQLTDLRGVFLIMFIVNLGWGFFTEFSPVFLIRYLGFNLEQIANFYAWLGLWIALSQGLLMRPFFKKNSLENVFSISLLGLACILPIMLWLNGPVGLFWLIPFIALAEALIFPTAATLVSNLSDKKSQGEVLGIYNSVQWAAIGISPMFSGSLVALYPHLPVSVGSFCMALAFFLALRFLRKKRQTTEDINPPL